MKKEQLKKIIKSVLTEVQDLDRELHVKGYALVRESRIKARIAEDLKKAQIALEKQDWNQLNTILGRTGNGVIPEMITTLKNNVKHPSPEISQSKLP